jgi:TRAP-type C4-dicarboxylate transport system substrate-binding protein
MQVSRVIKENLLIDSKSFNELPPLMKEAIKDVFDIIEKETGNIIEKFENAVSKVAEFHNINVMEFFDYVDKEVLEQLGEK